VSREVADLGGRVCALQDGGARGERAGDFPGSLCVGSSPVRRRPARKRARRRRSEERRVSRDARSEGRRGRGDLTRAQHEREPGALTTRRTHGGGDWSGCRNDLAPPRRAHGATTLSKLKQTSKLSDPLVLKGLGWAGARGQADACPASLAIVIGVNLAGVIARSWRCQCWRASGSHPRAVRGAGSRKGGSS
jgi:hypothetical protein